MIQNFAPTCIKNVIFILFCRSFNEPFQKRWVSLSNINEWKIKLNSSCLHPFKAKYVLSPLSLSKDAEKKAKERKKFNNFFIASTLSFQSCEEIIRCKAVFVALAANLITLWIGSMNEWQTKRSKKLKYLKL